MTEPVHFDTRGTTAAGDDVPRTFDFTLNDDPTILTARRPKSFVLVSMASAVENTDPLVQMQVVTTFLNGALVPESRTHLLARLNDPEDDLDVDDLTPIVQAVTERWFNRPTGRRAASARSPRSTGTASTATAP